MKTVLIHLDAREYKEYRKIKKDFQKTWSELIELAMESLKLNSFECDDCGRRMPNFLEEYRGVCMKCAKIRDDARAE